LDSHCSEEVPDHGMAIVRFDVRAIDGDRHSARVREGGRVWLRDDDPG
jgi:hypothetical protein